MSEDQVKSKFEVTTIETTGHDPWGAFREVEKLSLEFTQQYHHSLGKYSKFFIELENKKFLATECESCQKVYAPPRPLCPECLNITSWKELSGEGTLKTYSVIHFSPGTNEDVRQMVTPYVLAYVLMDGASTLFPHVLKANLDSIEMGMRVKVTYTDETVDHPIHLMHFVPLEAE